MFAFLKHVIKKKSLNDLPGAAKVADMIVRMKTI